jgi:hypothetical protein
MTTVLGGTLVWATAFTSAVYRQGHTRVQATQWIYQNIPAPFHLELAVGDEQFYAPIGAPDGLQINRLLPYQQQFTPRATGQASAITIPHIRNYTGEPAPIIIRLSSDPQGLNVLDAAEIAIPPSTVERGVEVQGFFQGAELVEGQTYYLTAETSSDIPLSIFRNIIANEDWDEGLPVPFDGYNPFGQFYTGVTMQVRWTDTESKRAAYLENLNKVDYIILPSQRSIWSISRLPRMYPLTIRYYQALFDGWLGFYKAAEFHNPWKIGPLWISDVAGTIAWNHYPPMPRFNFNFFAAEEAFSVYDHPPVWIYKKRFDFSMTTVETILNDVDLSNAAHQSPYETKVTPIQ